MLNELYHSLDPVAFSAGPITVYWYGISYIVGAVLTGVVMYRTQRRWGLGISVDDLMTVVIGVVFGLLIGGRLFYVLFYGNGYYFEHPLEILATNHGGMSFHGGLVGGIVGGVLACRLCRLSAWTVADLAVIGAPVALALGRCANFVNGELWGKPTDLPWGVVFESGGDVARHPSQLTEQIVVGADDAFVLHPGQFALGTTLERIAVPDDVLGKLEGKSSLGRLGLMIHSTAGYIDPGWDGQITLELSNVASLPILLRPGMRIGQISFERMSSPVDLPYGSPELGSHYQGQTGATAGRPLEAPRP